MRAFFSLICWLALLYFGLNLIAFAIGQHQMAIERQERAPIELRRGTR